MYVKSMPYICHDIGLADEMSPGCGDDKFWKVVKLKHEAIPYLIQKLTDSTTTGVSVPNFGYYYTTADIAYTALQEIIHGIPTFELLGVEFDEEGCGYCSYWQHLNKDYNNRKKFKEAVLKWFESNIDEFVWVESNRFSTCDCGGDHPNGGHLELQD